MAYMKLLIAVALIAGIDHAVAQFAGAGAFAGAAAGGFPGGIFGNGFPFGAGGFPNLPQPPALPLFGGVTFPPFQVPSPADVMKSVQPGPNSHGVMTVSNYQTQVGPDGKVVRTGGTTILANDGKDVKEVHFGDNPPIVNSNTHSVQSSWVSD